MYVHIYIKFIPQLYLLYEHAVTAFPYVSAELSTVCTGSCDGKVRDSRHASVCSYYCGLFTSMPTQCISKKLLFVSFSVHIHMYIHMGVRNSYMAANLFMYVYVIYIIILTDSYLDSYLDCICMHVYTIITKYKNSVYNCCVFTYTCMKFLEARRKLTWKLNFHK